MNMTMQNVNTINTKHDALRFIVELTDLHKKGWMTFREMQNAYIDLLDWLACGSFSTEEAKQIEATKLVTITYNYYINTL